MEQKRLATFAVLSMGLLLGWNLFVVPKFFPPQPRPAVKDAIEAEEGDVAKKDAAANEAGGEVKVAQGTPEKEAAPAQAGDAVSGDPAKPQEDSKTKSEKAADDTEPKIKLPEFPPRTVTLGSEDFQSEFRQFVTLTSRGGAVEKVELNDPRYKSLLKPHPPLTVVGSDDVVPFTLAMSVPQAGVDISRLHWEVADLQPADGPHTSATFRIQIDDLEITKHYALTKVDPQAARPEAPAYELKAELKFRNLGKKSRVINYELQGPTGLPLENVDNTQKFRDVVVGFVSGPGTSKLELMSGKTIAEGKGEEWQKAFDYIGVDVQYFAALLVPKADQRETPYTRSVKQKVIGLPLAERSEVSVVLTSVDLDLEASGDKDGKDSVTHSYALFAGPKRDDLLPPGAEKVVDFGMFHWISRPMLTLLKAFHSLFGSWGVAVICLTIVVRSALFPLSIKQARGAAKMQELQPEIAALKEKYGKDKEKMARAQMELFSKHNYNPLAGCLPVFLQLPIFMGLYQALNHAVDLRMARFLYIENLAAPDALFPLPFIMPFFGWKEFNLLPLITVSLFLVQQKMFMPPPANDEQAMQQKMMNFMMVFMGVMFYKVPAGLCVYFIASSLWGMAERKLLPKAKPAANPPAPPAGGPPGDRRKPPENDDGSGAGGGLFAMLLKAAEKETSARRAPQTKRK